MASSNLYSNLNIIGLESSNSRYFEFEKIGGDDWEPSANSNRVARQIFYRQVAERKRHIFQGAFRFKASVAAAVSNRSYLQETDRRLAAEIIFTLIRPSMFIACRQFGDPDTNDINHHCITGARHTLKKVAKTVGKDVYWPFSWKPGQVQEAKCTLREQEAYAFNRDAGMFARSEEQLFVDAAGELFIMLRLMDDPRLLAEGWEYARCAGARIQFGELGQ